MIRQGYAKKGFVQESNVPEIPKSDLIVLLFNAEEEDIIKFQASNIDVDLIIRSKSKQRSDDGGKKRIPVYSCGDRGKYLYQLDLKLSPLFF